MPRPLRLSGRCFWGRRSKLSDSISYTLVNSREAPLSLVGNSYYERRFAKNGDLSCSTSACASSSLPPLRVGDIVVKMGSPTPLSLRERRVVDVTGIRTSYLDASERQPGALSRVDDVLNSMHLHNGHEVPELNRGVLAVGRLTVLCAFGHGSGAKTSLLLLENAAGALVKRRSLSYSTEAEGIQLVRVIAEHCSALAEQETFLRPVARAGIVTAVRLQT